MPVIQCPCCKGIMGLDEDGFYKCSNCKSKVSSDYLHAPHSEKVDKKSPYDYMLGHS